MILLLRRILPLAALAVLLADSVSAQPALVGPVWMRGARSGAVTTMQITPDGTIVATAAEGSRNIRLWDPATGLIRFELRHANASYLRFLDGGTRLASAGTDDVLRLWSTAEGRFEAGVRLPGFTGTTSITIDDAGERVAWADLLGNVKALSLDRPDSVYLVEDAGGGHSPVARLWFTPGGDSLVVVAHRRTFEWDIVTRDLTTGLRSKRTVFTQAFDELGAEPSASRRHVLFIRAPNQGTAPHKLVDSQTGAIVDSISVVDMPMPMQFDGDGLVIGRGRDGALVRWDASTRIVSVLATSDRFGSSSVNAVALHPGGAGLLVGTLDGGVFRVLDGEPSFELTTAPFDAALFAPGDTAVTTIEIGRGRRWSAATGELLSTWPLPQNFPRRFWQRPAGIFASYGGSILRIETGDTLLKSPGWGSRRLLGISSSGERLLVASEDTLELWDFASASVVTRLLLRHLTRGTFLSAAFSSDDRFAIVSGSSREGLIVDLREERVAYHEWLGDPIALVIAPDGRHAYAGITHTAPPFPYVLFDIESGAITSRWVDSTFRPGFRLATVPGARSMPATDGTGRVWLFNDSLEILSRLEFPGSQPTEVSLSSDVRFVALETNDNSFAVVAIREPGASVPGPGGAPDRIHLQLQGDRVVVTGAVVGGSLVAVSDLLGNEVARATIAPGEMFRIPADELADGMYLLRVSTGGSSVTLPLIISGGAIRGGAWQP